MPEIRMRRKHQVTLPASIVRAAKIAPDDRLLVSYTNGAIIIKPKNQASDAAQDDVMAYAGIGRGLWGAAPDAVAQALLDLHAE